VKFFHIAGGSWFQGGLHLRFCSGTYGALFRGSLSEYGRRELNFTPWNPKSCIQNDH
jgi:hypothetical protein